jgi:disulfide bond formation protein DsbB
LCEEIVVPLALSFLLALVLTEGNPAAGQAASSPGNAARGKSHFEATCATCHGPDAKGLPGLGKDLTASAFVRNLSDQALIEFIKQGRPVADPANTTKVEMPPRGDNPALSDQDLADVVAYIRTLQR